MPLTLKAPEILAEMMSGLTAWKSPEEVLDTLLQKIAAAKKGQAGGWNWTCARRGKFTSGHEEGGGARV